MEYVGHNLENKDETTTKGGSVSLSQSSIPISGVGQKFDIVGNGKEKIEIKINGKKIKERNVLSIRSNSNGMHNSSYILIGTDDGKIKVIFGSPKKYEYNPTNIERAELIFVEQPKSK